MQNLSMAIYQKEAMDSIVTGKRKFDRLEKHNLFAALEKKDIRAIHIGGFLPEQLRHGYD